MQFKNGTDVAMLNAMLNVIVEREALRPAIHPDLRRGLRALAKENIKDFTPEEMAPICGIEADTLREVARAYARAESAIIFWGMGVSQHTHGTDNARCLIALALISGQIGRPGTGLHPLRGQNNVQGASDAGLIPMFFPDYKSVENAGNPRPVREGLGRQAAAQARQDRGRDHGRGPRRRDQGHVHRWARTRRCRTPISTTPARRWRISSISWCRTSSSPRPRSYADVMLPASGWPEKDGTVTNTNRQVQMGRQALPLPGEARQDLWIIQEIANRMGCGWNYKHVGEVFTEMASMMPALDNITWDRVEREHHVTYPIDGPDIPGRDVVFENGFPRPGGFAKLVATKLQPPDEVPDARVSVHPHHRPPARALAHRLDDAPRHGARRAGAEPRSRSSRAAPSRSSASSRAIRCASRRAAARSSCSRARTTRCRTAWCSSRSPMSRRRRTS